MGDAPEPKTGEEVLKVVDHINYVYGKPKKKINPAEERTCFKKKSIFFNLEYWKWLYIRHCLDVMHIEKNLMESLIGTLLNMLFKSKDSLAARHD